MSCGSVRQVYCSGCGSFQPVIEEEPHSDDRNDHPWADVVCGSCHLVLLTFRWVVT